MTAAFDPRTPAAERCPSYYSATLNQETHYPTCLLYTSDAADE